MPRRWRLSVPKYLPRFFSRHPGVSLGNHFHFGELGTLFGIAVGGFFFEWIESPLHRQWVWAVYHWLTGGFS
jgi:hypothetical protein